MKNYSVTVNGVTYDVGVEEVDASASPAPVQHSPKPASSPKPQTGVTGVAGSTKISAPMPGNIIDVRAKVGATVKNGDVIAVLEAMKMENDIVAPKDGVIASMNVSKGEAVNTGTLIATMN